MQLKQHITQAFTALGHTVRSVSINNRTEIITVVTTTDTFRFEIGSDDDDMPFHSLTATVRIPLPPETN